MNDKRRIAEFDVEEVSLVDKGANGSKIYCIKRVEGVAPDPAEAALKAVDAARTLTELPLPVDKDKALIAAASVAQVLRKREPAGLSDTERESIMAFACERGASLGNEPSNGAANPAG